MAALFFYLLLSIGFLSTPFVFAYLNKRGNLTHHQQSLVLAIGLLLTLLISFFAPAFLVNSRLPDKETMIFGIAFSACFGVSMYVLVRVFLLLREFINRHKN